MNRKPQWLTMPNPRCISLPCEVGQRMTFCREDDKIIIALETLDSETGMCHRLGAGSITPTRFEAILQRLIVEDVPGDTGAMGEIVCERCHRKLPATAYGQIFIGFCLWRDPFCLDCRYDSPLTSGY